MVPGYPATPAVHWVGVSPPRVGATLMVKAKVPLAVAPVASWTLKAALPKLPAAVGVPLTVMVLPLSDAVRPAGRLVAVRPLNEPVPALMGMVPLKPGRLTVQADDDSVPSAGAALIVMLNVPVPVAPVASCTVTD